jgi:hypothetical protein
LLSILTKQELPAVLPRQGALGHVLPSSGLATPEIRYIQTFGAMGSCSSRAANPIDAALLQALIEAKKQRNLKGLTFNELLLKFPKV